MVRQQARKELLAEARKHRATKLLRQIPGIGPLRAAHLVALMQTPHRFRTKRQLWTYSGLGLETHDSAQYRVVEGQLQRAKKPVTLRGLNTNHNHDLKAIFKGAAMRASTAAGPLHDFYEALLAKGRKPTMARLTLARKIAAITLIVWKKEVRFRRQLFETSSLSVSDRESVPSWGSSLAVAVGFLRRLAVVRGRVSTGKVRPPCCSNTRVSDFTLCPLG